MKGRKKTGLKLPRIPVAAESIDALKSIGRVTLVEKYPNDALIFRPFKTKSDATKSVWCKASLKHYRKAYQAATDQDDSGELQPIKFGNGILSDFVDVDHVYPKSWANQNKFSHYWIMMYPVMSEVNRSAGSSIEKRYFDSYSQGQKPAHGIIWALDYQIMKMLSHEVYGEGAALKLFD